MFGVTLLAALFVGSALSLPTIPPVGQTAARARYTINSADWAAVSSISTMNGVEGYPFTAILAMSDGPLGNGSGIAYLYLTKFDPIHADLQKDNRCTIAVSLAETDYCKNENLDPMDPRCVRVVINGKFVQIDEQSAEYTVAQDAILARHPSAVHWPTDHGFYPAKLEMEKVFVLDYFGGLNDVPIDEYLNANL